MRDISLELTKAKLLIDCVLKNNKRLDNISTGELDKLYENFDGIQRKMITELMPLAEKTGILATTGKAVADAAGAVKGAFTGAASKLTGVLGIGQSPADPPAPPAADPASE